MWPLWLEYIQMKFPYSELKIESRRVCVADVLTVKGVLRFKWKSSL